MVANAPTNTRTADKSQAQVHTQVSEQGELGRAIPTATYKKFRQMRHDPTLSIARRMLRAGVLASTWSVQVSEDAPEGAQELIDEVFQPMRTAILRAAIQGWLDYGWQPWELITKQLRQGQWGLHLKPLLQDWTEIIVEEDGTLLGVKQEGKGKDNQDVELAVGNECVVMSFDVEGTDWYGTPMMWDAIEPYEKWKVIEAAAARYDAKVAGSHWVVYYPVGTSNYQGREDVDNFVIAQDILKALESSGLVAIPRDLDKFINDNVGTIPADFGWSVTLLTDGAIGRAAFTDRQKYLDALKVRAIGIPERAILEGQFGTKAEAGEHGDFAITNIEQNHGCIVEQLNETAVNYVLRVNYGPDAEGTVWIEVTPLLDKDRAFLQQLYQALLASPDGAAEETFAIDRVALRDKLGVPQAAVEADPLTDLLPGKVPMPGGTEPAPGTSGRENDLVV